MVSYSVACSVFLLQLRHAFNGLDFPFTSTSVGQRSDAEWEHLVVEAMEFCSLLV